MAGFEDLEDDIELPQLEVAQVQEPRKLSRLQKKKTIDENVNADMGIDTPESEARGSLLAGEELVVEPNEPELSLSEEGAQSGDNDDADVVEEEVEGAAEAGEEGKVAAAPDQVWDEEDEIEQYFKEKSENGRGDQESDSDSGSDSDEGYAGGTAAMLGDNPTLDELNAETQRILRETAARDRLGKGQKIEIKPLTGIVAKLKERRALAIARAPKPRQVDAMPNFEDILAEATGKDDGANDITNQPSGTSTPKRAASPVAEAGENNEGAPADGVKDTTAAAEPKGLEKFLTTPKAVNEFEEDDELDLEVVSEDEDDGGQAFKVVELPSTRNKEPKPSPLIFNPYNETQDIDEFEDEPLIDDGVGDEDSDSESERSWEIRKEGEEGEDGEPQVEGKKKKKGHATEDGDGSSSSSSDDDDDDDDDEAESGEEEEDVDVGNEDGESPARDGTNKNKDVNENENALAERAAAAPLSTAAIMLAAANAVTNDKTKRMQRKFLDTEAELSDEDGAAAAVSDDEEEDNLDDNGELADLITIEQMKTKDLRTTEEYHNQWAKQNDAKELQQVLRGLENGFRRNRFGGGLDDANDEIHGRLRRARFDGDDFEGISGAFAFPSAFGAGNGGQDDEEECEDEAMLNQARRQKILAGSQNNTNFPGAIPLDDDSQAVLGLLARSASESQGGAGAGWMAPPAAPPSRLALELRGLNPDLGKSLKRGPSFVGRQSTVVRTQNGGGMGLGSGRSFVFGRSENSNSALVPDGGMPGSQQQGVVGVGTQEDAGAGTGGSGNGTGPVSFANLRQMAGLPGSSAGAGGSGGVGNGSADGAGGGGGPKGKKKRKAGSTLVSRLKTSGSISLHESQESLNAVSAVCMNIAQGPANRKRR
ncbi:hypothetical protein Ndes2526A_g03047 [Nannochloris sp. 'desiccata']